MTKEFSVEKWRKEKYGDKELIYLSSEECRTSLEMIKKAIEEVILNADQEFQEDLECDYGIVGAVIYGGWAREDVHTISDVDLFTIATENPRGLSSDFEKRLKKKGLKQEFEVFSNLILTNESDVAEQFKDLLKDKYIIVSPYDWVKGRLNEILSKQG